MGRSLFLFFIFFLIFTRSSLALIAFGNTTRVADFTTENSKSGASPIVSGSNILAVVAIGYGSTLSPVLSVTWNGVAMTNVASATTQSGNFGVAVFYLVNPASGSSTVAVSGTANWTAMFADTTYWTGVNQINPIDTAKTNTGASSSSFSGSITTNGANEYVIDTVVEKSVTATISGTGSTTKMQNGNSVNITWASGYQGNIVPASTVTMTWSSTLSNTWLQGVIAINPYNNGFTRFLK